jgi:hypothetical protein
MPAFCLPRLVAVTLLAIFAVHHVMKHTVCIMETMPCIHIQTIKTLTTHRFSPHVDSHHTYILTYILTTHRQN